MQIQTGHSPLWLRTHAKYYVKSGLTNVLKNANKTKNIHLFSIRIANYVQYLLPTRVFTSRSIDLWRSVWLDSWTLVYNFQCRENVRGKECAKTYY